VPFRSSETALRHTESAARTVHCASRLCQLPVLFCAGLVVGYFALPAQFGLHPKLASFAVVCATCGLGFALQGPPNFFRGSPFVALAIGVLVGAMCIETVVLNRSSRYFGFPVQTVAQFAGQALGDSSRAANGGYITRFAVTSVVGGDGRSASANAEVSVFSPVGFPFSAGEKAALKAAIRGRPVNESFGADQSKQFFYTASVTAAEIHRQGWAADIDRLRSHVVRAVLAATGATGGSAGPLLQALLTGNRDNLDPLVALQFRRAGCAHILALSGMHLGILTALLSMLFSRFLGKRTAYAVGLFFIVVFVWIAGAKPSLVRAALMFAVAGYASVRGRRTTPEAILSLCFGLQLVLAPETAMELSFQLSYLAIGGVILASPIVVRLASHYLTPQVATLVGAGIGAQFAVLPLVAGTFGEAFPIGLAAGIVLGPLVTLFVWCGLSTMAVGLVGGLLDGAADHLQVVAAAAQTAGQFARSVTESIGNVMSSVVDVAATVPGVRLGVGAALLVSLCAIGLLVLFERWASERGISGPRSSIGVWPFSRPVDCVVDVRDDR